MSTTRLTLLARMCTGGDPTTWEEFHAVYGPLLTRFASSQGVPSDDVPDVVQEIFAKLVRAMRGFQYDPKRARFRTWLFRVAHNQIADWRRAVKRRREVVCAPERLADVTGGEGEFNWDDEYRTRVLEFVLASVREETHRLTWTCFVRKRLQGRTAPEIAQETGLTESGVYTNSARVFQRVRERCLQFDEDLDDEHSSAMPG